jgi:hypothetical protein
MYGEKSLGFNAEFAKLIKTIDNTVDDLVSI